MGAAGKVLGWLMTVVNEEPSRRAIAALEVTGDESVLELGCGAGRSLQTMARHHRAARFTGLDHSATMLRMAHRRNRAVIAAGRMTLTQGRIGSLPWPEATFDKILLLNVAYFLDRQGRDIAETCRVLRPGGVLVIYVTDRSTMERWPIASSDTHRMFDGQDLADLLRTGPTCWEQISIESCSFPLGVQGLLATARKSAATTTVEPRMEA